MQQPMLDDVQPEGRIEIHRDHDGEVDVESDDGEEPPEDAPLRFKFSWRKLWRFAGPGWLMSLAYLDPGNLESDLQQGAYTGYKIVWVLFWATFMGLILQEMSARLGIVTGRDLAQTVRSGYPRWLNYVIYINMEIAVIGSDIQEVVGTGVAIYLLSNKSVPVWVGCIITAAGQKLTACGCFPHLRHQLRGMLAVVPLSCGVGDTPVVAAASTLTEASLASHLTHPRLDGSCDYAKCLQTQSLSWPCNTSACATLRRSSACSSP
jgi:hypothetical protein